MPSSPARSGPQPRQMLTFLFVVGDIFQQLSLHARVFPCLSLTQHCSLGVGRERTGKGKKKKEMSRFSSTFIHTLHLKEETIMDTSCLHHGQTSFCKITLPGNCHQGTGQRQENGKACPRWRPVFPEKRRGFKLRPGLRPHRPLVKVQPVFLSVTCLGIQLSTSVQAWVREATKGTSRRQCLFPQNLWGFGWGEAALLNFSWCIIYRHLQPKYAFGGFGFFVVHSNVTYKMQTISELQLTHHS